MGTVDRGLFYESKAPLHVPLLLPYDRLHLDTGDLDRGFLARPAIAHSYLPVGSICSIAQRNGGTQDQASRPRRPQPAS